MWKSLLCLFITCLITFGNGFGTGNVRGTCGTKNPHHHGNTNVRGGSCQYHTCDNPAVRDLYMFTPSSDIYNVSINFVYIGAVDPNRQIVINEQLAFFHSEYLKFAGIDLDFNVNIVTTSEYSAVASSNQELHKQIAAEYYVEGSATVLYTTFSPNDANLLGYAYLPISYDPSAPSEWFGIMDANPQSIALNNRGTTLLHEVGHMFGLFHPFIEENTCPDACNENMNSPNRNLVGDYCNDTMPYTMTFECNQLVTTTDCNGDTLGAAATLPHDNYMAYTPDDCQDQFTPQQAARMRCYLDKLVNFVVFERTPQVVDTPVSPPVDAPVATPITNAPTAQPVSSPNGSQTPNNAPKTQLVSTAVITDHASIALLTGALVAVLGA